MKKALSLLMLMSISCAEYSMLAIVKPDGVGNTSFTDKLKDRFNTERTKRPSSSRSQPHGLKPKSKTEQPTQQELPPVFKDEEIVSLIQILHTTYIEEKNIEQQCADITFHRFKRAHAQSKNKTVEIITGCLNKECSNFIEIIIGMHGSAHGLTWAHDGSKKSDQILKKLVAHNHEELRYCFAYPFIEEALKEQAKKDSVSKKTK